MISPHDGWIFLLILTKVAGLLLGSVIDYIILLDAEASRLKVNLALGLWRSMR